MRGGTHKGHEALTLLELVLQLHGEHETWRSVLSPRWDARDSLADLPPVVLMSRAMRNLSTVAVVNSPKGWSELDSWPSSMAVLRVSRGTLTSTLSMTNLNFLLEISKVEFESYLAESKSAKVDKGRTTFEGFHAGAIDQGQYI
jgi:hypothetical protein